MYLKVQLRLPVFDFRSLECTKHEKLLNFRTPKVCSALKLLIFEAEMGGVLGHEAPQNTSHINIKIPKIQRTEKPFCVLEFKSIS